MLKEYIDKLYQNNEEELDKLEKQMKEAMSDLESAKGWLEELQKESNIQINIFSPRNIDDQLDEKLQNAQNKVLEANNQIDYIRELIETHIKKRKEYEQLLKEAEIQPEEVSDHSITDEKAEEKEDNEKTDKSSAEIKQFLNDIYRKTEICLALLNGDKNRCKTELNDIRRMIKKFANEIENNEVS